VRQVLTVGAGYDGRSFRYGGPGIRWIELDHPATTAEKRRVLAAAAIEPTAVTVEVDLETADLAGAVTAAGWQATEPALFLCEGHTPYLTPATVDRTLAALRTLAGPGSTLVLDLALVPDTAESERERADLLSRVTAVGEPFRCVVERVAVPRLLARAGWRVGTAVDPAGVELQASAARTVFVAADPAVESIP
jgi:methyltransferase (TIGR00027 family)